MMARLDTIHTDRLALGPCREGDAEELVGGLSDPRVQLPLFVGRHPSREYLSAAYWIQGAKGWLEAGRFTLAARLRDGGRLVGALQLTRLSCCYFVDPNFWRCGYASEMLDAACEQVAPRLGLECVQASVMRDNRGSIGVLQRCGFQFVGLGRRTWSGSQAEVVMLQYRRAISEASAETLRCDESLRAG